MRKVANEMFGGSPEVSVRESARINLHLANRGVGVCITLTTINISASSTTTMTTRTRTTLRGFAQFENYRRELSRFRINSRPRKLARSLIISRDTLRHFARCQKFAFGCFAVAESFVAGVERGVGEGGEERRGMEGRGTF